MSSNDQSPPPPRRRDETIRFGKRNQSEGGGGGKFGEWKAKSHATSNKRRRQGIRTHPEGEATDLQVSAPPVRDRYRSQRLEVGGGGRVPPSRLSVSSRSIDSIQSSIKSKENQSLLCCCAALPLVGCACGSGR